MRLIDADRLTHDLTDWQMELYSDRGHEKEFDILDKVINGISTMPTEVTVVRCKKCVHWKKSNLLPPRCEVFDWFSTKNDYCSFAERRSE